MLFGRFILHPPSMKPDWVSEFGPMSSHLATELGLTKANLNHRKHMIRDSCDPGAHLASTELAHREPGGTAHRTTPEYGPAFF